jgi:beta-lactamase superfamily II metal-dependent hydrolase
MPTIKSYAVGSGDTFYIRHGSDNFTIIDCCLGENADEIIADLKAAGKGKTVWRFISTHPDDDHFRGLDVLDDAISIRNFYVVQNKAAKENDSDAWERYCALRDDQNKAYYIYKGCKRKWMNDDDNERKSSGIEILWPDRNHNQFKAALEEVEESGTGTNNLSAVIRYSIEDGPSFLWLGDLETEFMESITDNIKFEKTTVVFASHHGRTSGKIPDSWLEKLDPQIIVIGEAPARHLHYYTGYDVITQNSAWDILMNAEGNKVHFYCGNPNAKTQRAKLMKEQNVDKNAFPNLTYVGSLTVETEYTLEG